MNIRTIFKNISVLYSSQMISYVFSFLFIMHTARYLGAENFGRLSFALAFTGIFGILTDFGLRKVITREVSRDTSMTFKFAGNMILMKLVLSAATFSLIVLSVNILGYPAETKNIVYITGFLVFFNSFPQVFYAIFQAHEKLEYESIGRIMQNMMLLTGGMILINMTSSVTAFAMLYLSVSLMIFVFTAIVFLSKFPLRSFIPDLNFCRKMLCEAIPFGLIGVFEIIYHWIDTVMLSSMQGDVVVGWYNAAYRIFMFTLFIPAAVNMAVFPVMSRYYNESEDSLSRIHQKYFKYMSILGIFIGTGIFLLADKIVLLVYGESFAPAISALRILICSAVLIYINGAFVRLFESINRQKTITKIAGAAAVLNIILNLIFIPGHSYVGAGIATVLSELLILACVFAATSGTRFRLKSSFLIKQFSCISLACLSMLLLGYVLKGHNIYMTIISFTMSYFGIYYLVGGFDSDDIEVAKKFFIKTNQLSTS